MEAEDGIELHFKSGDEIVMEYVGVRRKVYRFQLKLINENLDTGEKERLTATIDYWRMKKHERFQNEIYDLLRSCVRYTHENVEEALCMKIDETENWKVRFDKDTVIILPFVAEKNGVRKYEKKHILEKLETREKTRLTISIDHWPMNEQEKRLAHIRKIFCGVEFKIAPTPDNS